MKCVCVIDCNFYYFFLSALVAKSARSIEGKLDKTELFRMQTGLVTCIRTSISNVFEQRCWD